jgi:hypothetical protein
MTHVRNVAIVLALALAVWLVPGGATTAGLISWLVGILFFGALIWFAARLYRENRVALYGLGDRNRAILYGAVAVAVLTVTATSRLWAEPAGVFVWFVLIGAASYAVYFVYRSTREY